MYCLSAAMSDVSAAAAPRPRPEPSALTEPFWDAARRHVLVRPRCNACGRSFFVPQAVCTRCLSRDWAYAPSSGRGAVYSATVGHRAPYAGIEAPFHLAIVDLDEGWSMLTNLIEPGDRSVPIGTRVAVAWIDVDDDYTHPVFTRDEEAKR
jgi:uncharacterized OB-fold protein